MKNPEIAMERQLVFEQHAFECNWHRCLLIVWEEYGVKLRFPGDPREIPGGDLEFPNSENYSGWHECTLSHEEAMELEKLLHLTRLSLAVPDLSLLDGADYSLRIRAGGQILHLQWQGHGIASAWSPLDGIAAFLESLHDRHARPQ